jgi:hypothetical protein
MAEFNEMPNFGTVASNGFRVYPLSLVLMMLAQWTHLSPMLLAVFRMNE